MLRSAHPWLQIVRSVILIVEVIVMVQGFVWLGLVQSHAVLASIRCGSRRGPS